MTSRIIPAMLLSWLCGLAPSASVQAFDLWRHPEIAEKNAFFIDTAFFALTFDDGFVPPPPMEIRADFMLPTFLPFSLGVFFETPDPNLKSFGGRLAYHIDIRDPRTDLYAAYVFDCGFVRNDLLKKYGDEPQALHFFDFRIGVRRFFGQFLGLSLETGFKLRGLGAALSIKLM